MDINAVWVGTIGALLASVPFGVRFVNVRIDAWAKAMAVSFGTYEIQAEGRTSVNRDNAALPR